jgi:hypothetical protein
MPGFPEVECSRDTLKRGGRDELGTTIYHYNNIMIFIFVVVIPYYGFP